MIKNNCTYKIKGVNKTFQNEIELNKYLIDNHLNKSDLNAYIFSLSSKAEVTKNKIINLPKKVNSEDLLGTYDFLDIEHLTDEIDELGNPIKKLLRPKYDLENRIAYSLPNYIKKVIISANDTMTIEEKARELLEKKIKQEDEMKDLGNLYHTLLKNMINGGGPFSTNYEYQKTLAIFDSEKFKKVQTINSTQSNVSKNVNNLMNEIWNYFNKTYLTNGGAIFTEINLKANEPKLNGKTGLMGRLDILAVTKEGNVNIYDLKLSTDLFEHWDSAKVLSTDYQLGVYRQLLAANGFKVDTSALKILPIKMEYGNINSLQLDTIRNRTIEGEGMQPSGLIYDGGKISETLKKLIPTPISKTLIENTDLDKKIKEDLEKILPKFETKSKTIPEEERLFEKYKYSSVNGEYKFHDELTQKVIKVKSEEELRKTIHDYVERSKAAKNSKILQLKAGLIDAINTNKVPDNLLNTKTSSNVTSNKILTLNFEKYTKKGSGWRLIDDIDELNNIGVIAFENIHSGIIEVVSITSENLNNLKPIGLGHTILGKFMNDDSAYNYDIDIMNSSVKNLETMKIFSVLNNLPELFKNRKLGTLKVINYLGGESEIINLESALENFNILSGKAEIINNYTNGLIKPVDMFDYIKSELNSLLIESDDKGLKTMINGAFNISVADNKKEILLNLTKLLNNAYPSLLKGKTKTEKLTFNTEIEKINALLSWGLSYYSGLDWVSEAKASKYGLNFGEIFTFLGSPFVYNLRRTTKEGYKITGPLQGLQMSTSSSIPNKNLIKINNFMESHLLQVRKEYSLEQSIISNATKEFLNENNKSNINRLIVGNNYDLYDDLFVITDNGKLLNNLTVKNPFNSNSGLNQSQIKYLKTILWSINKFKIPKLSSEQRKMSYTEAEKLEEVKNYINSGEYFEIPLRRASEFQRLKNFNEIGIKQYFSKKFNELKDTIDQRHITEEEENFINNQSENRSVMPNHHKLTRSVRQNILDTHGVYDFERNLDLIALDNAFNYIKEKILNEALPVITAFSVMVRYRQDITGENFDSILQSLDDQLKVTFFNESLIDEELKDVSKVIQVARSATSTLHIAARPLLSLKELTVGQLRNIILASNSGNGYSNSFSHKSLLEANKIFWGEGSGKYGNLFKGEGDIADFTLIQAFNNVYGFANMDINQIVEKTQTDRYGITSGISKWMYWTNSFPDFVNRMTLFLAKMIEDKAFSAHSLDKFGNLVYDFEKDERFEEYNKYKNNPNYTSKTFLEQKALYRSMLEEFKTEGYVKEDGSFLKFGDDLPRAYTTKQKASLKEFSDTMYGFYDQEAKSLQDQTFIGLIYKQFATYWTSKLKLWGKARSSDTSQGSFKHIKDKEGKLLYWKTEVDSNGNISRYETTDNDGTLEPIVMWEGDIIEGLFYSVAYTFRDLIRFKFKDAFSDKQRLTNLKLAMRDILVGIIIYNLFKMAFTNGSGKQSDVDNDVLIPYKILTKAMNEFDPISSVLGGLNWDPAFHKTFVSIQKDGVSMLAGNQDLADILTSNISMLNDFKFNEE